MAKKGQGVLNQPISETPVAVFDFETTGLNAGVDRVVEVTLVRIDPDKEPKIVMDTLINPNRKMAATEIHGITDEEVKDAPNFEEIAGDFVRSTYDCILASYNIYFDLNFLLYELSRIGLRKAAPHICLMYMRPLLGLGCRCCLENACQDHGIKHLKAHQSAGDALSAVKLWDVYRKAIEKQGLKVFGDLTMLKSYKFLESLAFDPFSSPVADKLPRADRVKSRIEKLPSTTQAVPGTDSARSIKQNALHDYWEALKACLVDLEITNEELRYLEMKKRELGLFPEEIRALHGKAFAGMISQCVEDRILDDKECQSLRRLYGCLSKLGWAPGQ